MKTKLTKIVPSVLICSALAGAGATDLHPYPGQLRGRIINITKDGVLVDGAFDTGERDKSANEIIISGTLFLRGFKGDAVDGNSINCKALPGGSYSYTTVMGANATVRAFRFAED